MRSSCGDDGGWPKISALDACTNATGRPTFSCTRYADSSSATAAVPFTSAARSGHSHDCATELTAARL